jgi:hypothetical protein
VDETAFRLQLVATVVAEQDRDIARALADNYSDVRAAWQPVHSEILRAHGLKLREGITLDQLGCMFTALAEGLALRQIAEKDLPMMDHEAQRSLAGTAAIALLLGCTERIDDADGQTVEAAVRALIGQADPH